MNGGNTEGLFHGAFMQSGTFNSVGDVAMHQHEYNALVERAGGKKGKDSLEYLRNLDREKMKEAVDGTQIALACHRVCLTFLKNPKAFEV